MCIRRQRPVSHWRLARSHTATVPFVTNDKPNDGRVPSIVKYLGKGRAQRTPSESGSIRDRDGNGHRSVATACTTGLSNTTTVQ